LHAYYNTVTIVKPTRQIQFLENPQNDKNIELFIFTLLYGLNIVQNSKSMAKDVIWTCFKHSVHF